MSEENQIRAVGLDVGTGNIASAEKSKTPGKLEFRKIRDCFLKIDPEEFMDGKAPQYGEGMLKKTETHFIKMDEILYVLGDRITLNDSARLIIRDPRGIELPERPNG